MNKLLFGTAGIPISTVDRNTANGIKRIRELGLGAMELEFVRNVNISKDMAPNIKETANKNDIVLTCHGQYFVNLASKDPKIMEASKQRMLKACETANSCGAWSICYHMAYHLDDKSKTYEAVKKNAKEIVKKLKEDGNKIWLRAETGGKVRQFGDIKEMIRLSQEVEQVLPCIDFAHHHSRTNGKFNTYEEYCELLTELEKGLGRFILDNMHCHIEGINYNEKGELNHLNLDGSDFNYKDLVKAIKDFKLKGVITCESPNIEEDALLLQNIYKKLK